LTCSFGHLTFLTFPCMRQTPSGANWHPPRRRCSAPALSISVAVPVSLL
jgi:hypothetical protein